MTDDERVPATVEAALAQIQGSIDAGFADLRGQIALVLQRADQTDRRVDDLTKGHGDLDTRLRVVETTMATRERIDAVNTRLDGAVTKDELDQRQGRTRWLVGLMVSVAAIAVTGAVGLLNTFL